MFAPNSTAGTEVVAVVCDVVAEANEGVTCVLVAAALPNTGTD